MVQIFKCQSNKNTISKILFIILWTIDNFKHKWNNSVTTCFSGIE